MNHSTLKNLLDQGLSLRSISTKLNCSLATTRYWTKKLELKSNFKSFKQQEKKEYTNNSLKSCPKCKAVKSIKDFYLRKDKIRPTVYCKSCSNIQATDRQKLFKKKCIEYKGGKCTNCGYNKYIGALEFHHLDPNKKDFSISQSWSSGFTNRTLKELDKCILLCANCHREAHNLSDSGEI